MSSDYKGSSENGESVELAESEAHARCEEVAQ
jgi:hypothetical protein